VKRVLLSVAFLLLGAVASADISTDEAFQNLADEYVSDLPNFSPVFATYVGDHSADNRLDYVDAAARARNHELLIEYVAVLEALDLDDMTRANQIDAEILMNQLRSDLWAMDELQEWAWNPLYYTNISGSSIYSLVARDFAPIETRLRNVTARLLQIPRFLEQAREALQPERVPKIHAETAIAQNPGLASTIDTMIVPEMDALSAEDQVRLAAAIEIAKDAIADHQTWLEEELLPGAAGNFRIGAELYDSKLAFALSSPLNRKEITVRAEQEYATVRNAMYGVAKTVYQEKHPYTAFPDDPDESYKQTIIRAALEQAYSVLPPRDGIVAVAKQQLQQATDFVVEKNIVTMPNRLRSSSCRSSSEV